MHVLHLGSERGWRGGENQIRLLIEGLESHDVKNSLAYPHDSRAMEHFAGRIPLLPLPSTNPFHPLSLRRVIKYCRTEGVDILDAHSAKAHQLGLLLKEFLPQIKLVVHRRVDNIPSSSWWTKRRYLSGKVDHYTVISKKIGEVLQTYGVPSEKISLVYSAIDIDKYRPISRQDEKAKLTTQLGLSNETFLIGNASALTPQKGYETLIDGLEKIKNLSGWVAVIAGEGALLSSLKKRAETAGVSDRVHFIGFVDHVPHFLSALDLVCVPSNNEGLGTLILDTMAAGTPVIASRVGGIPEIIVDGDNGILIDKGDAEALAKSIKELMQDGERRKNLAHHAYQKLAGGQFSLRAMVSGNKKVYESL